MTKAFSSCFSWIAPRGIPLRRLRPRLNALSASFVVVSPHCFFSPFIFYLLTLHHRNSKAYNQHQIQRQNQELNPNQTYNEALAFTHLTSKKGACFTACWLVQQGPIALSAYARAPRFLGWQKSDPLTTREHPRRGDKGPGQPLRVRPELVLDAQVERHVFCEGNAVEFFEGSILIVNLSARVGFQSSRELSRKFTLIRQPFSLTSNLNICILISGGSRRPPSGDRVSQQFTIPGSHRTISLQKWRLFHALTP